MRRSLFGLLCILALFAVCYANDDTITDLPGMPADLKLKQYSGYITVDESHDRNLFYWFIEAENNPSTSPLVLWLTGGPGCSGLSAMFTEMGPFRPTADGKLVRNEYAWTKYANMLFIESPSGVGYSFSNTPSDYTTGDQRTANDTYNFLQGFLAKYPQFAKNDFWITGESYAGHYAPNLAKRVVQGNIEGRQPKINLVGLQVGNAWTVTALDNYGAVFFWWSHALISDETFHGLNSTCDFSNTGPLKSNKIDPVECNKFQSRASAEMGNIDIYDIYADVCLNSNPQGFQLLSHIASSDSPLATLANDQIDRKFKRYEAAMKDALNSGNTPTDPCIDSWTTTYLNREDVRQAIHAKVSYRWSVCSPRVHYSRADLMAPVLSVWQYLLTEGAQKYRPLRTLIYSGDTDAIVPVTGSRLWVNALNLPITAKWRPWIGSNKQVGGYVVEYKGLTFATVRGAGHMVPSIQPLRSLDLFSRYLKDQPI